MKKLIFFFFLLLASGLQAQDKYANAYVCTKGKIHFFSSSPLEDIEATSSNSVCVVNTQSKKVIAKVTMTSFTFNDKLMQEHFNENYMESDKYPTSILDMTIVDDIDFSKDGTYDITLKGTLEMHGIKQEREIKGKLAVKNGAPANASAD